MKVEGLLRLAVLGMAGALVLMLVTLLWPTPHMIGLFLGPGLALAAFGVCAFGLRVVRDLRARRLL
jgi:hypothetical protein